MDPKEKIKDAFERLQHVTITATQGNLEAMLLSLYDLKNAYDELEQKENKKDG